VGPAAYHRAAGAAGAAGGCAARGVRRGLIVEAEGAREQGSRVRPHETQAEVEAAEAGLVPVAEGDPG
jgi:hypothetical protein